MARAGGVGKGFPIDFMFPQRNPLPFDARASKIERMGHESSRNHPERRVPPSLDDTDRAIIEHLQRDGRSPYTRIGQAVGLSEAAARQRVQRLVESDVVQIVAVTNPLSLGYRRMAMIGLRIEGDLASVAERLGELAEVAYVVVTAGSFDLLCEVVVADDAALLDVLGRIRSLAGVRTTETFVYLDIAKQTYTWGAR
jgi:Lrp/AsnC family transcriptional regulator for asnA, asnC and gidA